MKRIIMLALVLCMVMGATTAYAGSGLYVGGKIALTDVRMGDVNLKAGSKDTDFFSFGIGPVIGFDLGAANGLPIRLEAEVLYRTGDDWSKRSGANYGKLEINYMTTVLANAWWDITSIPAGTINIKPFIGASAGFGVISYEAKRTIGNSSSSKDSTESAFIIGPGGGVRFDLSERLAADASVRYLFSTDYEFSKFGDHDAPMLDFNFGLAYKF